MRNLFQKEHTFVIISPTAASIVASNEIEIQIIRWSFPNELKSRIVALAVLSAPDLFFSVTDQTFFSD